MLPYKELFPDNKSVKIDKNTLLNPENVNESLLRELLNQKGFIESEVDQIIQTYQTTKEATTETDKFSNRVGGMLIGVLEMDEKDLVTIQAGLAHNLNLDSVMANQAVQDVISKVERPEDSEGELGFDKRLIGDTEYREELVQCPQARKVIITDRIHSLRHHLYTRCQFRCEQVGDTKTFIMPLAEDLPELYLKALEEAINNMRERVQRLGWQNCHEGYF